MTSPSFPSPFLPPLLPTSHSLFLSAKCVSFDFFRFPGDNGGYWFGLTDQNDEGSKDCFFLKL